MNKTTRNIRQRIKDYHIFLIIALLLSFLATIDARIREFFILSAGLFALGFMLWIIADYEEKNKNKKRRMRKYEHLD